MRERQSCVGTNTVFSSFFFFSKIVQSPCSVSGLNPSVSVSASLLGVLFLLSFLKVVG